MNNLHRTCITIHSFSLSSRYITPTCLHFHRFNSIGAFSCQEVSPSPNTRERDFSLACRSLSPSLPLSHSSRACSRWFCVCVANNIKVQWRSQYSHSTRDTICNFMLHLWVKSNELFCHSWVSFLWESPSTFNSLSLPLFLSRPLCPSRSLTAISPVQFTHTYAIDLSSREKANGAREILTHTWSMSQRTRGHWKRQRYHQCTLCAILRAAIFTFCPFLSPPPPLIHQQPQDM